MKFVRMALGVLLGLYVLLGGYHAVVTIGHKTGAMTALPADAQRVVPLMDAIGWWQILLWIVALVLYAVVAWRLLRAINTARLFAVAFVVDIVGFLTVRTMPVYTQVFTPAELRVDYYITGALVLALLVTWWSERGSSPSTAAA